jgi:hypothetical protein
VSNEFDRIFEQMLDTTCDEMIGDPTFWNFIDDLISNYSLNRVNELNLAQILSIAKLAKMKIDEWKMAAESDDGKLEFIKYVDTAEDGNTTDWLIIPGYKKITKGNEIHPATYEHPVTVIRAWHITKNLLEDFMKDKITDPMHVKLLNMQISRLPSSVTELTIVEIQ